MAGFASIQKIRLATGVILFAFVATHLVNHALGLISLDAMQAGRKLFLAVWRNPVGTVLLYGSLLVHAGLVLYSLFRRRRLRMPAAEAVQVILGFAIPLLIATHILGTRGAHELFGVNDTYAYVVLSLWVWDWQQGLLQTIALIAIWVHGCLGLYFWLRLRPFYPRLQPYLFALALLVPTVGLAGFASAGKEATLRAQDDAWLQAQLQQMNPPSREAAAMIYRAADAVRFGSIAWLLGVLGLRLARIVWERTLHRFTVAYPDGRRVTMQQGHSVLDASRAGGVPHASVCGGRGRCSTCRIRIVEGRDRLPAASVEEIRVLKRVGAPDGVRLACQLRPLADLTVLPLLPATAQPQDGFRRPSHVLGAEREIAILFADLRSFTKFAERKLPYDVVFMLNQYFRAMGQAIEGAGGRLDKFIGDGVMALFGVDGGAAQGCRDALNAARAMSAGLADINEHLKHDLGEPLRMGIGIHMGHAIVGEMGYQDVTSLTAIGDAVNTASRLEALSKEFASELVISQEVAAAAGLDLESFPQREIEVRGREERMRVLLIATASMLPEQPRRRGHKAA